MVGSFRILQVSAVYIGAAFAAECTCKGTVTGIDNNTVIGTAKTGCDGTADDGLNKCADLNVTAGKYYHLSTAGEAPVLAICECLGGTEKAAWMGTNPTSSTDKGACINGHTVNKDMKKEPSNNDNLYNGCQETCTTGTAKKLDGTNWVEDATPGAQTHGKCVADTAGPTCDWGVEKTDGSCFVNKCYNSDATTPMNQFATGWTYGVSGTDHKCTECTCENGLPIADGTCSGYGKHECASCHPGHRLVEKKCVAFTKCKCEHGQPDYTACADDSTEVTKCKTCNVGFKRGTTDTCAAIADTETCEDTNCKTVAAAKCWESVNDTGVIQTALPKVCEECDTGFVSSAEYRFSTERLANASRNAEQALFKHAHRITCKKCKCANGIAIADTACTTDGEEKCASCFAGYVKDGDVCKVTDAIKCTCANGTPADVSAEATTLFDYCDNTSNPAAAKAKCKKCDDGFHFNADFTACEANTCTCALGEPVATASCNFDGTIQCKTCTTEGYTLNAATERCWKCKCANGLPVKDGDCTTAGTEKCQANGCLKGYTFQSTDNTCKQDASSSSSKTGLIVGIVVGAVVLLAVGAYFAFAGAGAGSSGSGGVHSV